MGNIVGIVVGRYIHILLLKTLNHKALLIEVGEADGADNLVHTALLGILHHLCKQSIHNLGIVHKVKPREAHLPNVHLLVVGLVEHTCRTTNNLTIPQRNPHLALGIGKGSVLLGVKLAILVHIECRHKVGAIFIEPDGEFDKSLLIPFVLYFPYFQHKFTCVLVNIFLYFSLISLLFLSQSSSARSLSANERLDVLNQHCNSHRIEATLGNNHVSVLL